VAGRRAENAWMLESMIEALSFATCWWYGLQGVTSTVSTKGCGVGEEHSAGSVDFAMIFKVYVLENNCLNRALYLNTVL
jgi:hypothetical protein